MCMKKNKKNISKTIGVAQETYWDYAGKEAVNLVGKNIQIKGKIHEIVYRDKMNLNIKTVSSGEHYRLSKSITSVRDDVVKVNSNGIILERVQLKDVISKKGQFNLKSQMENGKYNRTKIFGTEETADISGKIKSSGISSKSTTRAADNTGSNIRMNNSELLKSNLQNIGKQSMNSTIISGLAGTLEESIYGYKDFKNGNIDASTYGKNIAKATAKSAAVGGGKTASALLMKESGKQVAKKIGKEGLKKFAGSNAATGIAFGLVEQGLNTVNLVRGKISGSEYGQQTVQNIGSTGGAIGGAIAGAAIGSAVPIIGTAIGGFIGGIIGSFGGGFVGKKTGKLIF